MNELRRQNYLSQLGIDSYFPRWELPAAKLSKEMSGLAEDSELEDSDENLVRKFNRVEEFLPESSHKNTEPVELQTFTSVVEMVSVKELLIEPVKRKHDSAPLTENINTYDSVKPFTLRVWRYDSGLLVIDEHDAKQALPTDLFLKNIMMSIGKGDEGVHMDLLRWPLVENKLKKLTYQHAREELQTWFDVQSDVHKIKYVWLMGATPANYFLPETTPYETTLSSNKALELNGLQITVTQSLSELLLAPLLKKNLMKLRKLLLQD